MGLGLARRGGRREPGRRPVVPALREQEDRRRRHSATAGGADGPSSRSTRPGGAPVSHRRATTSSAPDRDRQAPDDDGRREPELIAGRRPARPRSSQRPRMAGGASAATPDGRAALELGPVGRLSRAPGAATTAAARRRGPAAAEEGRPHGRGILPARRVHGRRAGASRMNAITDRARQVGHADRRRRRRARTPRCRCGQRAVAVWPVPGCRDLAGRDRVAAGASRDARARNETRCSSTPPPWSIVTNSRPPTGPANVTMPSAGARTSVPRRGGDVDPPVPRPERRIGWIERRARSGPRRARSRSAPRGERRRHGRRHGRDGRRRERRRSATSARTMARRYRAARRADGDRGHPPGWVSRTRSSGRGARRRPWCGSGTRATP